MSFDVTEDRLKEFCAAVGGRYRGEAPPTFMTVLRDGEFELFKEMGIPLKSVLHGDQEFRYLRPIRPGDRIEYQTVVSKAFEKQGSSGLMRFIVFETELRAGGAVGGASQPALVGVSKTTVIVREKP